MSTTVIDARAGVVNSVIVGLAGRAAERRARRRDHNGFALWIQSERHLTAIHEAGHAVAAIAVGRRVYGATVRPDPTVLVGTGYVGGLVRHGTTERAPPETTEKCERIDTDEEKIARACFLLAPELKWRAALRCMRQLREESRAIVDRNWPLVLVFSAALVKSETLGQEESERLLRHAL